MRGHIGVKSNLKAPQTLSFSCMAQTMDWLSVLSDFGRFNWITPALPTFEKIMSCSAEVAADAVECLLPSWNSNKKAEINDKLSSDRDDTEKTHHTKFDRPINQSINRTKSRYMETQSINQAINQTINQYVQWKANSFSICCSSIQFCCGFLLQNIYHLTELFTSCSWFPCESAPAGSNREYPTQV